jgi:hypothetical protein
VGDAGVACTEIRLENIDQSCVEEKEAAFSITDLQETYNKVYPAVSKK